MTAVFLCEESQECTIAFREKGIEAYSCDLLCCSGWHPEWHLQKDALAVGKMKPWDLVVSFPPCTHLAVSGAHCFRKKRLSGEQEAGITFFLDIWEISHVVENPIGIMGGGQAYIKKWFPRLYERIRDIGFPEGPAQIIQPWQFGHGETKATCLWIRKGLPLLQPTNIITGRDNRIHRLGSGNAYLRSKTYPGIAKAMAAQWGIY